MAEADANEAVCQAECPKIPIDPVCSEDATLKAKQHCNTLLDPNGAFKVRHWTVLSASLIYIDL